MSVQAMEFQIVSRCSWLGLSSVVCSASIDSFGSADVTPCAGGDYSVLVFTGLVPCRRYQTVNISTLCQAKKPPISWVIANFTFKETDQQTISWIGLRINSLILSVSLTHRSFTFSPLYTVGSTLSSPAFSPSITHRLFTIDLRHTSIFLKSLPPQTSPQILTGLPVGPFALAHRFCFQLCFFPKRGGLSIYRLLSALYIFHSFISISTNCFY